MEGLRKSVFDSDGGLGTFLHTPDGTILKARRTWVEPIPGKRKGYYRTERRTKKQEEARDVRRALVSHIKDKVKESGFAQNSREGVGLRRELEMAATRASQMEFDVEETKNFIQMGYDTYMSKMPGTKEAAEHKKALEAQQAGRGKQSAPSEVTSTDAKRDHARAVADFEKVYDKVRMELGKPAGDTSLMQEPRIAAAYRKVSTAYDKLKAAGGIPGITPEGKLTPPVKEESAAGGGSKKLSQGRITHYVSKMVKDGVPVRFMHGGQSLNIESGELSGKGTNVMNQMIYWNFSKETAREIAKELGVRAAFSKSEVVGDGTGGFFLKAVED